VNTIRDQGLGMTEGAGKDLSCRQDQVADGADRGGSADGAGALVSRDVFHGDI
jgi:hypothetical protein